MQNELVFDRKITMLWAPLQSTVASNFILCYILRLNYQKELAAN